jgi:Zn finger protein HypA/HybF involved in hydrogenase expression
MEEINMHDGCSGTFDNGLQVLEKVRMMGFSMGMMPVPAQFTCECGQPLMMDTFEYQCPICGMVYAVTPCHAFDVENIQAAGKNV